jgi:hypothetical protein
MSSWRNLRLVEEGESDHESDCGNVLQSNRHSPADVLAVGCLPKADAVSDPDRVRVCKIWLSDLPKGDSQAADESNVVHDDVSTTLPGRSNFATS